MYWEGCVLSHNSVALAEAKVCLQCLRFKFLASCSSDITLEDFLSCFVTP